MTASPLIPRAQFSRAMWRAVVPLVLLLVAQAGLLTMLLMMWLKSAAWVQQSEMVIAKANDIERLLVNMETGVRGYMLTADPNFLQPFERARPRIGPALEDLKSEVRDNLDQVNRLNYIANAMDPWLNYLVDLGEPVAGVGMNARQLEILEKRRVLMDGMRRRIQEIIQSEAELKSTSSTREERMAQFATIGGVALSVLLGVALALASRRTVSELVKTYQGALDAQMEAGKQFSDLAEAIPQLVWIADAGGKHLYFNQPWLDYTGRRINSFLSEEWRSTLHPEDFERATAGWKASLEQGKPFESEYRLKRSPDGVFRWFLCRATPVLDRSGRRVRWFGTCTDVDHQKQIEAQREAALAAERAARSELLRTSRVKDEFLATLSHELRTPMTAILGWARLLRDPSSRAKNLDRAIESIETNAAAQARLIDDLLDMSRIISGKMTLKLESLDLAVVIRAAVEGLLPAAANKRINLSAKIAESAHIQGDAARLQQVFWNLLSNAVKFTPAGGRVTVELIKGDVSAMIIVSDTGPGIEAAFLPYVFDRFRQADATLTRRYGGLGLGLAITRNLVELHGGSVGVASDGKDKGATFTVELPLAASQALSHEGDVVGAPSNDVMQAIRDRRVLVVDDSPDTAQVVAVMLENVGMKTATANSGETALKLVSAEPFDVLISDIGMPLMDGYALIRRIREREQASGAHLCAVALSAFARPEDRKAALDAGYDSYLVKPVTPDQLYRAVAAVLTQSRPNTSWKP